MPNELAVGTRRVGDFIDFYPGTPEVKVTLERSESGISVTIPWSDSDSQYAQWFTEHMPVMGIPAAPEALPVPQRVLFEDSHGSVLLTRCWPRGFHSNLGGPGSGTLWARAAILGPRDNLEFERPDGLQTEISGLRAWLGVSSWDETHTWVDRRRRTATFTSHDAPVIEVGEYKGVTLEFQPGARILSEEGGDRRVLLDFVRCVTRSKEPLDWDTHGQFHRAVRDLLVVSRWHPESCVEVLALRRDDPLRTMDGKTHGEQWRSVVVAEGERTPSPSGHRAHLLQYEELGTDGILRWLSLRNAFARAVDPVISSIELRRATTANTLLAHTGPGLEALGYLLMLRDGESERTAARANLQTRFERILSDLDECLPFDGPTWASKTVAAYNGLKHANRDEPDPVDVVNAWRESVLVMRAWIAVELGTSVDEVKIRLAADPQRHPYVKVV